MSLENTHDIGKVKIVMVGAGGGGASSLSDLSDTNIVNPLNGQLLGYNSLTGKWGNVNGGGGGGDSYAGLGIGKKKTVTSGVIDTDIELHRAPIVGDRLLIWFDAGVDNPTGIITYNNGTAVTSNVESVSLLSYKNGWNIFEFKNDGLLYINCWVRVQNVPIPNNTLSGLSDTQISTTPTDGQVLTFDGDNNKWKNMALPTVQANTGTANAELKKLKIGNVVYNADSVKHYDVSAISNGAISVSVPNAGHLDGEIIAVNTGSYTGSTGNAWTMALNDGQTIEALTMSKADGTAFTEALTANSLMFVKCNISNSTAVVLGIVGAGSNVSGNGSGSPTSYLNKLKIGSAIYDASAIRPFSVAQIANNNVKIYVADIDQLDGKVIALATGALTGTTSSAWSLNMVDTSGGAASLDVDMLNADGTAFTDDISANELLFVSVNLTNYEGTVLSIAGASGGGGGVATSVVGTAENGTTASQAYAVGEHFIRNDKFCTAIASIASGAALTLNTNYVEGTIAEAIYNLTFYLEQTVTLSTSAETTATFTSAKITANSLIDLAISEWGLIPSNVVVASGTCTVTLPKVDSAHSVVVRIYVR